MLNSISNFLSKPRWHQLKNQKKSTNQKHSKFIKEDYVP